MRISAVAILLIAVFFATPLFASPEAQIKEYLEACRNLVNGNMDRFASMKQDELLRHLFMALICSEPEISSRLEEHERDRVHGLTERFKEIKKTLPKDKLKGMEDWEMYFKVKYEEEMGKARIYSLFLSFQPKNAGRSRNVSMKMRHRLREFSVANSRFP